MTALSGDEIEQIRAVVVGLHHAADLQDWDWFGRCITASFSLDGTAMTRGALLDAQRTRAAAAGEIATQHQLTSLLVEPDGEGARAIACQTIYRFRRGARQPAVSASGSRNRYGLQRTAEGWRVNEAYIELLWTEGDLGE